MYPFVNTTLPVLPDCNNYYSGRFKDYFWHQNADQVYVYIPVDDHITKREVTVNFEARKVIVNVKGEEVVEFDCLERIIPEGSFWVFEADEKEGKKYLQLDLEKRFRMINWKNLFGEATSQSSGGDDEAKRNAMLEKLFAANKGISQLTGASPESVEEMINNPDLYTMLNEEVNTSPQVVDEDGRWNKFSFMLHLFNSHDTHVIIGTTLQALESEIVDEAEADLEEAFREVSPHLMDDSFLLLLDSPPNLSYVSLFVPLTGHRDCCC